MGGRAEQVGGGEVEAGRVEEADLHPLLVEGLGEGEVAARVGRLHRRDQLLGPAARAEALEQAEAVGDQDPARGRRRVGEDFGAAEGGVDRLALDRLVGGEVAGADDAAVADDEVADRRRHLAPVEGLGPLGAVAFQRLGQFREAEDVALAQRPSPAARRARASPACRSWIGARMSRM